MYTSEYGYASMIKEFDFEFTKQQPPQDQDEQNRALLVNSIATMQAELARARKRESVATGPNVHRDAQELEKAIGEYETVLASLETSIFHRKLATFNVQILQLEGDLEVLDKAIKYNTEEQSRLREQGQVDEGRVQSLRKKSSEFSSRRQSVLRTMEECDKKRAQLLLTRMADR